jgi:PAS domain S-box-containing protein
MPDAAHGPGARRATDSADLLALLEALSSQLVVVDQDGGIRLANQAWRERTAIADYLTAFQMVARPELDLLARVRQGVDEVLGGQLPEFVVEYQVSNNGEPSWMLLRAAPLATEHGRHALIAHVDITARKRAERLSNVQHEVLSLVVGDTALGTTLERLAEAIEHEARGTTCLIATLSPDGNTVSLGAAPTLPPGIGDQLEGAPVGALGHFVDGAAAADLERLTHLNWARAAAAHGYRSVAASPIRARTGAELGVVFCFYPVTGAPSPKSRELLDMAAPLAAISIERHRTVRALRERENRLQSLFILQPDAVITLDATGRMQSLNPAAEHLLGESSADVSGQRLVDLVPATARQQFQAQVSRALTGYPQRFTAALCPKSRGRVDVDLTLVPLSAEGGVAGVYAVAKDITEQLAAAERLEQSGKQLRQSAKMEAVGRLAGGIAHDFNNLLTAIRGYTDLLLSQEETQGGTRDDLHEISRAVERATSLTRQLLTFSRQQVVQPKLVDLNAVVEECRGMLSRLVRADTELAVQPESRPAWVRADPVQIHQVIINLVVNAQDAMPNGGRLLLETGRLEIQDGRVQGALVPLGPGRYVTLRVTDTGRGMDQETQARIFEPFFTTKPPGRGTGLGLSTVYGIVEQSGGRIGFQSAPSAGTSFVIYLPEQAGSGLTNDRSQAAPALPSGTETVLLVEDEETVRTMVRKILATAGYTVLEARHGSDGLLVSREYGGRIDLVLTDVVMPEMNGLRLAELIRAERPDARVIFMSGYTRDEVDRRGLTEPGVVFVHKPFTVLELATVVREVLDQEPTGATGAVQA